MKRPNCPNCETNECVIDNIPFVDYQGYYVTAKYVCGACRLYFDTENDLENLLEENVDVLIRLKER